jgi:hypothetical protein
MTLSSAGSEFDDGFFQGERMRTFVTALTRQSLALILLSVASPPAYADPVTLTFEGLANYQPVADFYGGGGGGNFGIQFSGNAFGLIDDAHGGGGGFANEPSPGTGLFFDRQSPGGPLSPFANAARGFTDSVEFFYTQPFDPDMPDVMFSHFQVVVFSGFNGTGRELGHWSLPSTGRAFDHFVKFDQRFEGTGRSLMWIDPNLTGAVFDNVRLNLAPTPEPATLWLVVGAVAAVGSFNRFRTQRRRGSAHQPAAPMSITGP